VSTEERGRQHSSATPLHVPPDLRRDARCADEEASVESAVWLIGHMCEQLGLEDLGGSEVLDFGCGVRFSQAFLKYGLPIKRYVGVDLHAGLIEFLQKQVREPRFDYHHVNAHNELYNPAGEVMGEATRLPIEGQAFDVICLFSVFTHLAPPDFRALLKLLRRFTRPDGRLFFSLYLANRSEGGWGLWDRLAQAAERLPREELDRLIGERPDLMAEIETFRDLDPDEPLKFSVYSESHARELIAETGWRALTLSPPEEHIQHHFVCEPA
jgi:SAM-dependent methyltransferase